MRLVAIPNSVSPLQTGTTRIEYDNHRNGHKEDGNNFYEVTNKMHVTIPDTTRDISPQYSWNEQRWLTNATDEEIQKFLDTCHVKDDNGQRITQFDKRNHLDDLFNSEKAKLIISEGEYAFEDPTSTNTDKLAREAFVLKYLEVHQDVVKGKERRMGTKWKLLDENVAQVETAKKLKASQKAFTEIEKANPATLKNWAWILGQVQNNDTTIETVETHLLRIARDTPEEIVKVSEMNNEEISLEILFRKGRSMRKIHKDQGTYFFKENELGQTKIQVINFLLDDKNLKIYDELSDLVLGTKKKKNVKNKESV